MTRRKKILLWTIPLVVVVLCAFCYFKYWWVFSEGTRTGELNSLTHTGYIFKTYEGEMILTGFGNKHADGGAVLSKNFKFSVSDEEVAGQLSDLTGERVTVHFREYKGALPWRGYERSVVDRVVRHESAADDTPAALPIE